MISYSDRERAVLCSLHSSLVAIAESMGPHKMMPVFVGDRQLAQVISEVSRFRVLSPKDLVAPLVECDLSKLGAAELEQIRYWKPNTVGQVVFNWWD